MKHIALAIIITALAGCDSTPKPPPSVVVPAMGPKTDEQIAALKATTDALKSENAELRALSQNAAGSVFGAKDANQSNPDGLPKEATAAQLIEAESALPSPTAEQKLLKQQQNVDILTGQLAKVKAEMGQQISENERLKLSLSAAEQRAADAEKRELQATIAAEKERKEAAQKLQRIIDGYAKRLEDAEKAARDKVANEQAKEFTLWGRWLTGAAVLAAGLAGVFGGIAGLRTVGPLAGLALVCGLACFGLAQIVSQEWFKWAVLGLVALVFGFCAWWAISKYKQGVLKEKLEAKAAKATGLLKEIVPVLDDAYDNAAQQGKELMDLTIFSRLKDSLTKEQRAVIHEVRAENAAEKAP